jgi:poly(glycerol-phosphate) alpha-glucosyltransferase
MKTLCIMDSVSRANGGIFEAERRLQQGLQASGVDVRVVGLKDEHTEADRAAWQPLSPVTFSVAGPRAFGFAPGMTRALAEIDADLGYMVGLWKYPSVAAQQWADRRRKPLVIAPHGMLDAWALRNSAWKKKIAGAVFQNHQLRRAACFRALCAAEVASIRDRGMRAPVCVVPNGIDLEACEGGGGSRPAMLTDDKKVLLYLGRLHPKKGLENLVAAWSKMGAAGRDWILVIAGWDQGGHEAQLRGQANELGMTSGDAKASDWSGASIGFAGPQFGEEKKALYRACDAFILPSFSEGLPMVVLEAWAHGKPVLMTPQCNLPEGFAGDAAIRVEAETESLRLGLTQLIQMSDEERRAMGSRGRRLVERSFSWPRQAKEMADVYRWILGGGSRPGCVDSI